MRSDIRLSKDIDLLWRLKTRYMSGTLTTHDLGCFIKLCDRRETPPGVILRMVKTSRTFYELEFLAKTYFTDRLEEAT